MCNVNALPAVGAAAAACCFCCNKSPISWHCGDTCWPHGCAHTLLSPSRVVGPSRMRVSLTEWRPFPPAAATLKASESSTHTNGHIHTHTHICRQCTDNRHSQATFGIVLSGRCWSWMPRDRSRHPDGPSPLIFRHICSTQRRYLSGELVTELPLFCLCSVAAACFFFLAWGASW